AGFRREGGGPLADGRLVHHTPVGIQRALIRR
ncbi:MAG: hypothetical protein ACI8TL_001981, partial [Natronomonas sp.]